jgi:lysyl-tRNA synthetase, class I
MGENVKVHWADEIAQKLITQNPKQEQFTVAAGMTPSGVVHIGNFRETITVDLVAKALMHAGKKVRFIYSWDDYDVFRKVPVNMPNQEMLTKYLRYPIVDIPDPFEKEESYARHNEVEVEKFLPLVGINPEFLYQAKKYIACEYAEEIKTSMQKRNEIKEIIDKYRKEPHSAEWYPASIFCEKCKHDETKIINYDGEYGVTYNCKNCGNQNTIDIRENGSIKLVWRVDWPMRWAYEKVDFEPSGKEHSSSGGSNTTAELIVKKIWNRDPPKHVMYEFISIKGMGGKMSSSKGNTINLGEMLNVYQPEIVRMIFASRLPQKYFEVSFEGMDVIRLYDEFQKLERIYFRKEECKEEDFDLNKRFYELSSVEVPKELPPQVSFKHIVTLLQIFQNDVEKVKGQFENVDSNYLKKMISRAQYWLEHYAEEQFKFTVQSKVLEETIKSLSENQKNALNYLKANLTSQNEQELIELFKQTMEKNSLKPKEFFQACYQVLINKDFGPQLSGFMLTIGLDKVKKLLEQI